MSIHIFPDQAAALAQLLKETDAVACDITEDEHWSLRVATYHARDGRTDSEPPAEARWWSISCAGTVREQAPTPDAVRA